MKPAAAPMTDDPDLAQKRRRQIVAAATQLFSSQGFYRTTVKDIANLAGISSGLIYHYIHDKDDVLLLVLLEVLDAYAREIPLALEGIQDPLERLMTSVSAYCRVVDQHRAATVLAYRSTKSLPTEKREMVQKREVETNQNITAEVKNCMRCGLIQKTNADVLTYQMVMIAHAWALKSWYFKSIVDIDDYIEATMNTVFLGALTPVGQKQYAVLRQKASSSTGAAAR